MRSTFKPMAWLLAVAFGPVCFALDMDLQPASGGVPAYEVLAPNGARNLLVGTLHVPHAKLRQPSPTLLDTARVYVVEHIENQPPPPAPPLDFHSLRLAADGVSLRADWATALSDTDVERLRVNISCTLGAEAPRSLMDVLMLAPSARQFSMLAYSPCAPPGLLSRDVLLQRAADQRGVATVSLESQRSIEQQRARLPERIYRSTLNHALTTGVAEELEKIADTLNEGNFSALLPINDQVIGPADARLYYRLMVKERNRTWMAPLRKQLDKGNAVALVGAAHLPGPEGLVALLRKSGYEVRPVRLPSDATPIASASSSGGSDCPSPRGPAGNVAMRDERLCQPASATMAR